MWSGVHPGMGFFPFFFFFPFGFLLFLALCALLVRLLFFRRGRGLGPLGCDTPMRSGYGYSSYSPESDPEAILKRRLANGDITEEEYTRLHSVLRDKE